MTERLAFTVREAAEALAVSRATLYRQIKLGKIRAVVIGGKTVIPRAELERILEPAA